MVNIAMRKCKFCGKEYKPNSAFQSYCKGPHYMICPVCGKEYCVTNNDKLKSPPTACSQECKFKRVRQTSIDKYGIPAPGNNAEAREKSKKTMQERLGVDYAMQSEKVREKSKESLIEKYGVDNAQKNPEVRNKTEQTNIKKYGSKTYLTSEEGKEKIDSILLDKYGTTAPLRNEEIRAHWKQTNIEKYGVDNPAKSEQIREKIIQSSLIKYGTQYPVQSAQVRAKMKDTFIRNYGVDNPFKSREIIDKIHKTFYDKYNVHGVMHVEEIASRIRETNMKRYGVPYYVMLPNVAKSSGRISNLNRKIAEKLKESGIDTQLEFSIGGKSYDILIPQGNILLEVDPSYTHSIVGNHWNPKGIPQNYHLKKTISAEENGYRCMHLWDWDCISKFINLLTTKNIIYDKVQPEIIDNEDAKSFIEQYSLYDAPIDFYNTKYVGIRYKSKLICLIGFNLDDILKRTWTITCIEHRFNYNVYTGYKKILDYFIEKFKPSKITAYADYSKSNGELLENLEFEYVRFMLPNQIWSKGRHAIIDDYTITSDAMLEDGWLPVYNCGYKVYKKDLTTNNTPLS